MKRVFGTAMLLFVAALTIALQPIPQPPSDPLRPFVGRIEYLCNLYNLNNHVYFALVPDDPSRDYGPLQEELQQRLPHMTHVDLTGILTADDYYTVDLHWRSDRLGEVANRLGKSMGVFVDTKKQILTRQELLDNSDTVSYPTDEAICNAVVTDVTTGEIGGIYWPDHEGYDFFLNGSSSLLTIEAPIANTGRNLVVLRDSFASSLLPWLVSSYDSITVVDVRYLLSQTVGQFVDFTDCDVLFLYSAVVVEHGSTLK